MFRNFLVAFLIFMTVASIANGVKSPTGHGYNNKDPRYFIKLKRMICAANPALVNLDHCLMKLERNTNGQYSVRLGFIAVESKMTIKVAAYTKFSANIYRLTPIQQSMDVCEFLTYKNRPNLVTLFVPTFFELIKIPDCPFKDGIEFNFTLPMLNIDPMFAMTGDHKLVLNVTRRASGQFLFSLIFEVYVKGRASYV